MARIERKEIAELISITSFMETLEARILSRVLKGDEIKTAQSISECFDGIYKLTESFIENQLH